ncbi:MAG: hypothetical protein K0R46_353 [Herbinix sp.]|jgi:hypothetical protein|nr:hypothetical protein [Herbinix sp.]
MNKIKLRYFGVLACLVIALLVSNTAQADVLWTPNDDFFMKHYEECESLGRSYTANGEEGYVGIKKNPESKETLVNKENGSEFFVSFTYTDQKDNIWGVVEVDESTGWVLMTNLVVVYDNFSFIEEHESEFQAYEGELDDYEPGEDPFQFYEYPGSGTPISWMNLQEERPEFTYTYTDSEDRKWGYVGYYFGHGGWICFSDPTSANLAAIQDHPEITIIPPSTEMPLKTTPVISTEVILLVVLVAAVVLGTALLIRIFFKKK